MIIRIATADDAAGIAVVHVESWRSTYTGIIPDDVLASRSRTEREHSWRQMLAAPESEGSVYVAEDRNGEIIGFISGGPERSGDTVYIGEIYALYLLASFQGQGIGRQLMRALVGRMVQEGTTTLLLWVLAANPARAFYERLGGQPVREKTEMIGGAPLLHIAYGWRDAGIILQPS